MSKRFFSLNPFRRKKRSVWKKGGAEEDEQEPQGEAPELEDAELLEEADSPERSATGEGDDGEGALLEEAFLSESAATAPATAPVEASDDPANPVIEDEVEIGAGSAPDAPAARDRGRGPVRAPQGRPAAPRGEGTAAPGSGDVGQEFEDLLRASGETPAPSQTSPPTAMLPSEPVEASDREESLRRVRDTVENLHRRAMTAGQLRETIERTIEARMAGIKETVSRIQELFRTSATAQSAAGEAADRTGVQSSLRELAGKLDALGRAIGAEVRSQGSALAGQVKAILAEELKRVGGGADDQGVAERLSALPDKVKSVIVEEFGHVRAVPDQLAGHVERVRAQLVELLGRLGDTVTSGVRSAGELASSLRDVSGKVEELGRRLSDRPSTEELRERLRLQEERLVSWLERLNVMGEREAERAAEARAGVRELLGELSRNKADLGKLRTQLMRARGNLASALGEAKEELWRSRIGRIFLRQRMEGILEPARTALSEIDSILKGLVE